MQAVIVLGRIIFVLVVYLFLVRVLTVLIADLKNKGIISNAESEFGCLEVLNGAEMLPKGRKIRIEAKGLKIGRGKQNDIVVPDHFCSVDHAEFKCSRGVTTVEDVGSTNGTWVNGERINSLIQLVPGDFVKVGSITFQYTRWRNEGI